MVSKKIDLRMFWKKCITFLTRYSNDILLVLIPIVLLSLYFFISRFNTIAENQIQKLQFANRLSINAISSYPILKNPYPPFLTAESAIIIDDESQVILYGKNPTLRFSMASTTKIMTALVALEHYKPDDVLTIYSDWIEGAEVGFLNGEQFYALDVIYGLMLPSGNDAAYALAENYPGGMQAFVKRMNEKAKEYQLTNTQYADPAGLNDDQNFTTAHDLARLASLAMRNNTFREITATKSRIITSSNGLKVYSLYNLNKLLGLYGVVGVKTGYTQGAGGVLVTAKEENDKRFILVVIKSLDRFADTVTLLEYLADNVSYTHFSYK